MTAPKHAREDLRRWHELVPSNLFTSNPQLQRFVRAHLGEEPEAQRRWQQMMDFGAVVRGPLHEAARVNNRTHNLPRLERWSDHGERLEDIEHHPSYHQCGKHIYQDGEVIAVYDSEPANLFAQALFFLSSHVGEAGHNCPVACTAGVVKALRYAGSEELKAAWLPGLLTASYPERLDGAQFLTEVQGGSDVGANAVFARPEGEAMGTSTWRIWGEKWFCSNADADLILMTARVEEGPSGTKGLGLFLVPRRLPSGDVNDFSLRRLKDKLGTRSMPSAEMDFNGALAYAVGPVQRGFSTVMTQVISTSRLYNTLGCAGIAHSATLWARGYALSRQAFGTPILQFPQVQQMIASMAADSLAITAGGLFLAEQLDGPTLGSSFWRIATSLAKLRSCQLSHRVVLTGIETLGGNGAIESFSILPRLLRDNVVYENWEGTHNVLVAQTFRDLRKPELFNGFFSGLEQMCEAPSLTAPLREEIRQRLQGLTARAEAALVDADPGRGALKLRPVAEELADLFFALAYAHDLSREPDPSRREEERHVLQWFLQHRAGGRPQVDDAYCALAERISRLNV